MTEYDSRALGKPLGDWLIARKRTGSLNGFDTAAMFDVSGLVRVRYVIGRVIDAVTSSNGATTIGVGVTGSVEAFLANLAVNGTNFAAGDIWRLAACGDAFALVDGDDAEGALINGLDINLYRSADTLTAGNIELIAQWRPLSEGASLRPT